MFDNHSTTPEQDTKIESIIEELFEQNLKDLSCSESINDHNKKPLISNILINEDGLKLKIILFKRVLPLLNSEINKNIEKNNSTRVGIMIAFLTDGFYGCELISIFDTNQTLSDLINRIRKGMPILQENEIENKNFGTGWSQHSTQHNDEQYSIEEKYVLDIVFAEIIEPFADIIVPLYNHLFSYCKKSNLLLRNNFLLKDMNILFHNHITKTPIQYLIPTMTKYPILIVKLLKREESSLIKTRGLTKFLLQDGFDNEIFPTRYWNSFSILLDQSVHNNLTTYKDHSKKAQYDFYTPSQISEITDLNNNTITTDNSSSFFKIGSDLYPQPITASLFSPIIDCGSTIIHDEHIHINIPMELHDFLVASLNEMNNEYDKYYNGLLIECGIHRGVTGHLLGDGSIFSNNNNYGKCCYWAFSSCRFDWCFDLLSDEMEVDKDTLIVKCCPKTMEDILTTLYYQESFRERLLICSKNPLKFTVSWNKNKSVYYCQDSSNQAIPIDADVFSLHGIEFFCIEEFKYNSEEDYLLQMSIAQIVLLSPPIQFSNRINASNMVRLVEFIFKIFTGVLSKNPTLPLEAIERFDIIVNCLDYGYVTFDLNSYYDKNALHSKLKRDWINTFLNVRKVLKQFINYQLLSFTGPKLSFCMHFQMNKR